MPPPRSKKAKQAKNVKNAIRRRKIDKAEVNKIIAEFTRTKEENPGSDDKEISRLVTQFHKPTRKADNLLTKWNQRNDDRHKNWKKEQSRISGAGHPVDFPDLENEVFKRLVEYTRECFLRTHTLFNAAQTAQE